MPAWFADWYPSLLRRVHAQTGDPERSEQLLVEAMTREGRPEAASPAAWQQQVLAQLQEEGSFDPDATPQADEILTESLAQLPVAATAALRELRFRYQVPKDATEARNLEALIQPVWAALDQDPGELEADEAALLWRYLARQVTAAEEHELRHWVDAKASHLQAFEARYELWERLGEQTVWLEPQPEAAWQALQAVDPPETEPSGPARRRRAMVIAGGLAILAVATLFLWPQLRPGPDLTLTWTDGLDTALQKPGVVLQNAGSGALTWQGTDLQLTGSVLLTSESELTWDWAGHQLRMQAGRYAIRGTESGLESLVVLVGAATYDTGTERFALAAGTLLWRAEDQWWKAPADSVRPAAAAAAAAPTAD